MSVDDPNSLTVRVSPTPLGTYVAVIEYSDDAVLTLTRDETLEYAYTLYTALARAMYDAAVLVQHRAMGFDDRMTARTVRAMRADRPELRPFNPYQYLPVVNKDGTPSVQVWAGPAFIIQLSPENVREHVQHAIEAHTVADLDAGYLRYLRAIVGLDETTARRAVGDLLRHRTT